VSTSGFYLPNGSDLGSTVEQPRASNVFTLDEARLNRRLARVSVEAPRVPWHVFRSNVLQWKAGEHFGLIGPTGGGKTTMLLNLLPMHPFVTVFATKPRDETMDSLINTGYVKMDAWKSLDPMQFPRRVLWPNATSLGSEVEQERVFRHAFDAIYREGGWTVAIDETWYMTNILNLGRAIKTYLLQARSLRISLICATQRPVSIPVEVYDQSTHLMFWRDNDERNLSRIAGISYLSADLIRHLVAGLESHQVLYINTRTGQMVRTRCPDVILTPGKGKRK
jgi:hypothetical protein